MAGSTSPKSSSSDIQAGILLEESSPGGHSGQDTADNVLVWTFLLVQHAPTALHGFTVPPRTSLLVYAILDYSRNIIEEHRLSNLAFNVSNCIRLSISQHQSTVDARSLLHIFPAAGTFMHLGNSLTCEQTQHIGNAEFGTTSSFCWIGGLYLMPRGFERCIYWLSALSICSGRGAKWRYSWFSLNKFR